MLHKFILVMTLLVFSANTCNAQEKQEIKTYGKITEIADLNWARAAHTATRLLDGNVLIVGGMQKNGVFYDEAEIFDVRKNSFTKLKSKMLSKRVSHTATLLRDGRVLIFGGLSDRTTYIETVEIFDPNTQAFAVVGKTKFPRTSHSATLLDNGKVLIAGGAGGTAELFDPKTNVIEYIGKMQTERSVHSATKLKDGRILFAGGKIDPKYIISDAEIFDPKTNRFTKVQAKLNVARYKHDAVLLSDGSVLIYGGSDERDRQGKLRSAEIFNPEKQTFTQTKDMNFARYKIRDTAVLLPNGKVLIAGGSEKPEIFNPETKSFERVSGELGKTLHFASVTLLKDGRALILGGYEFVKGGEPTSTNQAWIFRI